MPDADFSRALRSKSFPPASVGDSLSAGVDEASGGGNEGFESALSKTAAHSLYKQLYC